MTCPLKINLLLYQRNKQRVNDPITRPFSYIYNLFFKHPTFLLSVLPYKFVTMFLKSLRFISVVQKLHHEVESNIRRGLGLRPTCSFRHLNRFETLTSVQLYGSWIVQITVQCNGTAIPAPCLSFCLCY